MVLQLLEHRVKNSRKDMRDWNGEKLNEKGNQLGDN